ncbi:hypothetical protein [Tropicimonas sp. IMCC34043]|uniref:hypothetical protein n=1 Tax=Tropicimonas sp. IMCC34043 TaxID=2248760 RepID=UPI00130091EE|nr:hypothetical protein [Tropicimonas sp. IMCC34043]
MVTWLLSTRLGRGFLAAVGALVGLAAAAGALLLALGAARRAGRKEVRGEMQIEDLERAVAVRRAAGGALRDDGSGYRD